MVKQTALSSFLVSTSGVTMQNNYKEDMFMHAVFFLVTMITLKGGG